MKIAFLTSVFSFGGAQKSTIELAARLMPYHDVQFYDTYGSNKPFLKELESNSITYSIISPLSTPYIVSKHRYGLFNLFRYFVFIFKWYLIRKNAHYKLNQYQPDVVIVYDDRCLSYLIAHKNKHYRTLFYARGWYSPEQISTITKYLLKNFVDELICISEATRHAIYCSGITSLDKLHVIHNSINFDKIVSCEKIDLSKSFKIIHSGAFIPEKGHHISLCAAKILKDMNFDFHIYMCGLIYPGFGDKSRKYYDDLISYVKTNNLDDFVTFVVGRSDIISYIKSCDVMFFPSSSEGLPRSVLEAMTLGKPVISNAVGGVTDLILDKFTGFLTEYNNPIDYAKYAQLLFQNSLIYNRIASNAINLIKTSFVEKVQIDNMNELFDNFQNNKSD